MRSYLIARAAMAGLLASATPAYGQIAAPVTASTALQAPRWVVGFAADVGQAVGDFRRNVNSGAGVQAHALLRLDRVGRFALRAQGGWLNYGSETQRTCLGSAPQCRVAVNLTTANGILSVALGPQVALPVGPVRFFGFGVVGVSRFATVSGLGGGIVPEIVAGDENFGDTGMMWSGGAGVTVPVHRRVRLDLGIGYEHHGRREYLLEGGLTDRPDGTLGFDIKRSTADLFAVRIGFSTAVGRGHRATAPVR